MDADLDTLSTKALNEQTGTSMKQNLSYREYCHDYTLQEENEYTLLFNNTYSYLIFKHIDELEELVEYLNKIPLGRKVSAKNVLGLAQRIYPNLPYILVSEFISEDSYDAMVEYQNSKEYI